MISKPVNAPYITTSCHQDPEYIDWVPNLASIQRPTSCDALEVEHSRHAAVESVQPVQCPLRVAVVRLGAVFKHCVSSLLVVPAARSGKTDEGRERK
jgi:NADH:ubiquinone oxidoreductase subunit D